MGALTAALLGAIAGFSAGIGVTAYIARDVIRHKRRLEHLGFVAILKRMADKYDDQGGMFDARGIADWMRLEADGWQRAADTLSFRNN